MQEKEPNQELKSPLRPKVTLFDPSDPIEKQYYHTQVFIGALHPIYKNSIIGAEGFIRILASMYLDPLIAKTAYEYLAKTVIQLRNDSGQDISMLKILIFLVRCHSRGIDEKISFELTSTIKMIYSNEDNSNKDQATTVKVSE